MCLNLFVFPQLNQFVEEKIVHLHQMLPFCLPLGGGLVGDEVVVWWGAAGAVLTPAGEEPELCCITERGLSAEFMAVLYLQLGHTCLSELAWQSCVSMW